MDKVWLGIVGLGNGESAHAAEGGTSRIANCDLGKVCDGNAGQMAEEFFAGGRVDAVLIATPQFSHVPLDVAGMHLLVEELIALRAADMPANTAICFSRRQQPVEPPLDPAFREAEFHELTFTSPCVESGRNAAAADLSQSFSR